MTATLVALALLTVLNALYVAAEFAGVSARHGRVRQAAEEGSAGARWALGILEDPGRLDRYIAGCQVGITLTSLVIGAYGQAALTPPLAGELTRLGTGQGAALGIAATTTLVLLTSTQVVISELVPKSVALQFPTQTVIYTAVPMRLSLWLFRPLIAALNGSASVILRLLGAPTVGHRHIHSPEEISFLIAESRDGGLLSADEQERLDRALRLSILPVRRLMIPRRDIVGVQADATLVEVQRALLGSPFTRLPVYEDTIDHVVGVVRAKDVASRIAAGQRDVAARRVMRPIAHVPESIRAEQLVAELRRQQSEQAIVVDEYDAVSGIITLEDLLTEVLGAPGVTAPGEFLPERLPDGRVRLPGRMRVDEATDWLGATWEGESDTLGGIVTERLGHLPVAGERITVDGVAVEVEAVAHLAVHALIVTPRIPGDEDREAADE